VTMNRPEAKNALSMAMLVGMVDAWTEIDSNDDIRCAILTGAGGTFCSGMDLKSMSSPEAEKYQDRREADPDLHWKALLRPTSSASHSSPPSRVGGRRRTEILQATDIGWPVPERSSGSSRRAADSSPWAAPPWSAPSDPLHGGHGPSAHRREVSGRRGAALGLIGRVVPDGEALTEALKIAEVIAANGPLAVEAILRSVREPRGLSEIDGLAVELEIGWPSSPPRTRPRDRRPSPRSEFPSTSADDARGRSRGLRFRDLSGEWPPAPHDALALSATTLVSNSPPRCAGSPGHGGPAPHRCDIAPPPPTWPKWPAGWRPPRSGRRPGPSPTPPRASGFLSHQSVIGFANPVAPPVVVEALDGGLIGSAWFDYQYEGPRPVSTVA